MRSNKRKEGKPSHIVSAWSREDGFCLGQRAVSEKSNEITAIPELLDRIQIKGQIVTIDAMGTQKARENGGYISTVEKAHGQMEKREYYQTTDIGWLLQKKEWKGIKSRAVSEIQ